MTINKHDIVHAGICIRQYKNTKSGVIHSGDNLYHLLPRNRSELDDMMCKSLKRTGILCGECLDDHYPLAYSYNMTCTRCPNTRWNWARYVMAAYLPLTLFYFIIVFFKINTTSSHLFSVVYYCQTLSAPLIVRILFSILAQQTNRLYFTAAKVCFSLYGIWNLDFFRLFHTHVCLRADVLTIVALDYIVAMYPLLLMIISYLLIVLYDRNYRVVTIVWRPFRVLFSLLRKKWDIRTSIIDAFATFFFLSSVKLLSTSFDLLVPTRVYHFYPHKRMYNYTLHLLYSGDIPYFGDEHLPYAILALAILCVLVVFPILVLALYPFAFFQNFLNMFPFRWYILHTFVDSFYGCYKDGTQPGTRDYRWFASTFFGVRIIQVLLYSISDATISLVLYVITVFVHTTMVAVFRPFKTFEVDYNVINILFLQFAALFAIAIVTINLCTYMAAQYVVLFYVLVTIFVLIPFLYTCTCTFYWFYRHKKFGISLVQRYRAWRNGYNWVPEVTRDESDSLPDRIENSGNYPRENLANFVSIN